VKTLKTNTRGTLNMLGLAKRNRGKILLASAGDVYGNAEVGMWSWWLDNFESLKCFLVAVVECESVGSNCGQ
jgi:nucleoside-diphosphate-sugar epimerase